MNSEKPQPKRIVFIANCVYGDHVAGGDIHFFHMAQAAIDAGYNVHFFGGQALKDHLKKQQIPNTQTITDFQRLDEMNVGTLFGQWQLFCDYFRKLRRSLGARSVIKEDDVVYAVTDFWCDVLPLIFCPAKKKAMIWHMEAPSLWQIMKRSRPDVDAKRAAALHYWFGQNLSLWLFRFCRHKRMFYVHPNMREKLLLKGYQPSEIQYLSFGVELPDKHCPAQQKIYDAIWIGRVHRQKGIADLLATLKYLSAKIENFRAVLVGKLKNDLEPEIKKLGLMDCVEFAGFVSDEEKFRLFQASRVFLMTSRFEGSPRVVAEALVCEVPVVAYEVETYRPVFGGFLRYTPCFDLKKFQQEAELQIKKMRAGENYLSTLNLKNFSEIHSWHSAQTIFIDAIKSLVS